MIGLGIFSETQNTENKYYGTNNKKMIIQHNPLSPNPTQNPRIK